ncbi:MAG: response regulator transcription factor [Verrucomicrobia bacterium]|nr:response regulator transcription factor [Verrucomicrobiota bacterium]
MRIIIVKWDRIVTQAIRAIVVRLFPRSDIIIFHSGADTLVDLRKKPAQLALVGLTLPDIDGLDLVATILGEHLAQRLLVISGRHDEHAREFTRTLPVDGFFNPTCFNHGSLPTAIRDVMNGRSFFYALPKSEYAGKNEVPLRLLLSPTELRVFVIIGSGCDEQEAANRLDISRHTVHTHLQHVMRKLRLHTRMEVMRAAVSRGFVRFMPGRIVCPGPDYAVAKWITNAPAVQ